MLTGGQTTYSPTPDTQVHTTSEGPGGMPDMPQSMGLEQALKKMEERLCRELARQDESAQGYQVELNKSFEGLAAMVHQQVTQTRMSSCDLPSPIICMHDSGDASWGC